MGGRGEEQRVNKRCDPSCWYHCQGMPAWQHTGDPAGSGMHQLAARSSAVGRTFAQRRAALSPTDWGSKLGARRHCAGRAVVRATAGVHAHVHRDQAAMQQWAFDPKKRLAHRLL